MSGLGIPLLRGGSGVGVDKAGDSGGKTLRGDVTLGGNVGAAEIQLDLYRSVDAVVVAPYNFAAGDVSQEGWASKGVIPARGWARGIWGTASWFMRLASPPMGNCS